MWYAAFGERLRIIQRIASSSNRKSKSRDRDHRHEPVTQQFMHPLWMRGNPDVKASEPTHIAILEGMNGVSI